MNFFKFLFNSNRRETPAVAPMTSMPEQLVADQTPAPEPHEQPAQDQNVLTVAKKSGWPIDRIYGYLHQNFEEKGYNDAMVNNNLIFRDMNLNNIKNKILIAFREVNLFYDNMRRDIENRIKTCQDACLMTSVASLSTDLQTILAHQDELARLEKDFRNNANEASIPLQSYECGFLRGLSTIAIVSKPQQSA